MENDPNRNQEPIPKPLKDNCSKCKKNYRITGVNGLIKRYNKHLEASYLWCACSHCGNSANFFLLSEAVIGLLRMHGVETDDGEDYPDDETYERFLKIKGIELIQEKEVSTRGLNKVAYLRHLFDNDHITPEDFEGSGDLII